MNLCGTYSKFPDRRTRIQCNCAGRPESSKPYEILAMSPSISDDFSEVRKGIPEVPKHHLNSTRQAQTASALRFTCLLGQIPRFTSACLVRISTKSSGRRGPPPSGPYDSPIRGLRAPFVRVTKVRFRKESGILTDSPPQ